MNEPLPNDQATLDRLRRCPHCHRVFQTPRFMRIHLAKCRENPERVFDVDMRHVKQPRTIKRNTLGSDDRLLTIAFDQHSKQKIITSGLFNSISSCVIQAVMNRLVHPSLDALLDDMPGHDSHKLITSIHMPAAVLDLVDKRSDTGKRSAWIRDAVVLLLHQLNISGLIPPPGVTP